MGASVGGGGGGGGGESDNDSLYTKPEERASIVRPQRPHPLQQPLKLSILKPTAAAASAAKGALLSKFLPPWANRASHLSSASWVSCYDARLSSSQLHPHQLTSLSTFNVSPF